MKKYIIHISKFNNNIRHPGFKNKRLEVWDTSIILARDKALEWFPGYQCNMIWPE